MNTSITRREQPPTQIKSPWWVGYLVTIAAEAALTFGLAMLNPYLPLSRYPIPYVLVVMATAYFFGTGPAILALVFGLFMFDYYFVPPRYTIWPISTTREGLAGTVAFFMGMVIVGVATLRMRESQRRIQGLNEELRTSYERAHKIAETLQSSLMLPIPEQIDNFVFETDYRAALEEARVGGDFYDVFQMTDDCLGIVIGDVSGKGLKAAIQVAAVKYTIRGRAYECHSPGTVMGQVNNTLLRDMDTDSFITVFFGMLHRTKKTLSYANAGHSPVALWRRSNSHAEILEATGLPVGVWDNTTYEERIIDFADGDELLLSTDGLYEVRCGEGFLELEGLLDICSRLRDKGELSAATLVDRVVEHCHGGLRDDVAILHIQMAASP